MRQNKRELIQAVFHNEKADRIPVGFWHHFLQDEVGADAFSHPQLTEKALEGQADFYQAFEPDMIKIMTDGFFGYPHPLLQKAVDSPKELMAITPLGRESEWFAAQIRYARKLVSIYGKETPLFYNLFAVPRTIEFMQTGIGHPVDLSDWLKQEPNKLAHVLDVISDDYAELSKALVEEAKVDGIYLSVNNISCDEVTEEAYRKIIAPYEQKILEAANRAGGENILHICGYHGFHNHLSWYREYPFLAVNWAAKVEGVSLSEGKKLFQGKAVIGGFGQTEKDLIYSGTEEAIKAETRRLLDEAGRIGVILGADCTIPRDTPVSHLKWVREAANE